MRVRRTLAFVLALSMILGNTTPAFATEASGTVIESGTTITTDENGNLVINPVDNQATESITEMASTVNSDLEQDNEVTESGTESQSFAEESSEESQSGEETDEMDREVQSDEETEGTIQEATTVEQTEEETTVEETTVEETTVEETTVEETTVEETTVEETTVEETTVEETTVEETTVEETTVEEIEETTVEEIEETVSDNDMIPSVSDNSVSAVGNGTGLIQIGDMTFATLAKVKEYIEEKANNNASYSIKLSESISITGDELDYSNTKGTIEVNLNGKSITVNGTATVCLDRISGTEGSEIIIKNNQTLTIYPKNTEIHVQDVTICSENGNLILGNEAVSDSKVSLTKVNVTNPLANLTVIGNVLWEDSEEITVSGDLNINNESEENAVFYNTITAKTLNLKGNASVQELNITDWANVRGLQTLSVMPEGAVTLKNIDVDTDWHENRTGDFIFELQQGADGKALGSVTITGTISSSNEIYHTDHSGPISFNKVLIEGKKTTKVPFADDDILATVNANIDGRNFWYTEDYNENYGKKCLTKEVSGSTYQLKVVDTAIIVFWEGRWRLYANMEELLEYVPKDFDRVFEYGDFQFVFLRDIELTKDLELPSNFRYIGFYTSASWLPNWAWENSGATLNLNQYTLKVPADFNSFYISDILIKNGTIDCKAKTSTISGSLDNVKLIANQLYLDSESIKGSIEAQNIEIVSGSKTIEGDITATNSITFRPEDYYYDELGEDEYTIIKGKLEAPTIEVQSGNLMIDDIKTVHFESEENARIICDTFTQSDKGKTYLADKSVLFIREEGTLYNVNIGDKDGNVGNPILGASTTANLNLNGTFTRNTEEQTLYFAMSDDYSDNDKVPTYNELQQNAQIVEAEKVIFKTKNTKFPVEYVRVLPLKIAGEEGSEEKDNPNTVAYQSGNDVKVISKTISLYFVTTSGEERYLDSFGSWQDTMNYLKDVGTVDGDYAIHFERENVNVIGTFSIPSNVKSITLSGELDETPTNINFTGDFALTVNTTLNNVNLKSTKNGVDYIPIIDTKGKRLEFRNMTGTFSAIKGTNTTNLSVIESTIVTKGNLVVSNLMVSDGNLDVTGTITATDIQCIYGSEVKTTGAVTATKMHLDSTTLQTAGNLTVTDLRLIGSIVKVSGTKSVITVNKLLYLEKVYVEEGVSSGIETEGSIKLADVEVNGDNHYFIYGIKNGLNITGTLVSDSMEEWYAKPVTEVIPVGEDRTGIVEYYEIVNTDNESGTYKKVQKNAISVLVGTKDTETEKWISNVIDGTELLTAPKISSSWFVVNKKNEDGKIIADAVVQKTSTTGNTMIAVKTESAEQAVELQLIQEGVSYTLESFATLQEAFNEIDRFAQPQNEYRIILHESPESKQYTYPSQTAKLTLSGIVDVEFGNQTWISFGKDVTIKSNVTFENICFGASEKSKLNIGNFTVELIDCRFDDTTYSLSIVGSGVGKGSSLLVKRRTEIGQYWGYGYEAVWINSITNIDKLSLDGVSMYVANQATIGTLELHDETFGGYNVINIKDVICKGSGTIATSPKLTTKKVDNKNVITDITPNLTITGKVSILEQNGKLTIDLGLGSGYDIEESLRKNKGIILAKAPNVDSESIAVPNISNETGSVYKKAGNLIYKEGSDALVTLSYFDSCDINGDPIWITTYCETFADAVAEINSLKTKRDYTIRFVNTSEQKTEELKMPNKNYVETLTITAEAEVYYLKNIAFTSHVILDNVEFIQMELKNGEYQSVGSNGYPAPVTISTGGFNLTFAENKAVTFNTPISLDGGNKGILNLGEETTISTNIENGISGKETSKIQINGKITKFAQVNVQQNVSLTGWYTKENTPNVTEFNVTGLNISGGAELLVGNIEEEAASKITVKDLNLNNGTLTAGGKGTFTNMTLTGQDTVSVLGDTFVISGIVSCMTSDATLETALNNKHTSVLNISGTVVLEDVNNHKINVTVTAPEFANGYALGKKVIDENENVLYTIQPTLLKAKKADASYFLADASCVDERNLYGNAEGSKEDSYILKKNGENIEVYYADNGIQVALYKGSNEDELINYYATFAEAVTAIDSLKNKTASYTIKVLNDVGKEDAPVTLKMPTQAVYVNITSDWDNESKPTIFYNNDITLTCATGLINVNLQPSVVNGTPKGILMKGFNLLVYDVNVTKALGKIDGGGKQSTLNLTGEITVGNVTVTNLELNQGSTLNSTGSVTVTDIYSRTTVNGEEKNKITYVNPITINGAVITQFTSNDGTNEESPDCPKLSLHKKTAEAITQTGVAKVVLTDNKKLATIKKADLVRISFTANKNDDNWVWTNKGIYLTNENYTNDVLCGNVPCLDLTQAVNYINTKADKTAQYMIMLMANITDTDVTADAKVSKLVLPKKDMAYLICIKGDNPDTDDVEEASITFTGDIAANGIVQFANVALQNGAEFSITHKKNSSIKAENGTIFESVRFTLNNVSIADKGIKNITGEKNATELYINDCDNLTISGGITNIVDFNLTKSRVTTKAKSDVINLNITEYGSWDALGVTTIGNVALSNITNTEVGTYLGTYHSINNKKVSTGLPQLTITGEIQNRIPVKVYDITQGIKSDIAEQSQVTYNEQTKLVLAKTAAAEQIIAFPYFVSNNDAVKSYKDASNYVYNGNIDDMQVLLKQTDRNGNSVETYVKNYAEAIQMINNSANANADYTLTILKGKMEGDKEVVKTAVKNGEPTYGVLALPQAKKAKSLTITGEKAEMVIQYTGTLAPQCDVKFEHIQLTEGTLDKVGNFVSNDSITPNAGNVTITFGEGVTTPNADDIAKAAMPEINADENNAESKFTMVVTSLSGKTGTIKFADGQAVYSKGNIAGINVKINGNGNNNTRGVVLAGKGKITLNNIFADEEAKLGLMTYFTKQAWKKSVSQLTINGEASSNAYIMVAPFIYDAAATTYHWLTESEMKEMWVSPNEKPAVWKKVLSAPKLQSENVWIYADEVCGDNWGNCINNQTYCTKYEGGIYVANDDSINIRVEGYNSDKDMLQYIGEFQTFEQAVKEIDHLNHPDWIYAISLYTNIGTDIPLTTVPMPTKASQVVIWSPSDNVGIQTTSNKVTLKCDTIFDNVAITAVKKAGNNYYSMPYTLDASNYDLILAEIPDGIGYNNGYMQNQMKLSGTAKGTVAVYPKEQEYSNTNQVGYISEITKIGTVDLFTNMSEWDENIQPGTADYNIVNGITGVNTLTLHAGVDVNSKKDITVKDLNIGESVLPIEENYPSNDRRSNVNAKNITVNGTAIMASATLKAGTSVVGDGKITLNNITFKDMHNHIEGKQDKKGNSLIQMKGIVKAEGESIIPSQSAVTISLCLNNSAQRYAQLNDGMVLLTAPKAVSSLFRPHYDEPNKKNMGNEEKIQCSSTNGETYYESLTGLYKSGNYIKYGYVKVQDSENSVTDIMEARLWIGTSDVSKTWNKCSYMDFATFEDAVKAIDSLALYKTDENGKNTKVFEEYTIELLRDVNIGNDKGDGKYSALTLPTKASVFTLLGNDHEIKFSGNVTLRCPSIFESVTFLPMKAVKGGAEITTTNFVAGNYDLTIHRVYCGYWNGNDEFISCTNNVTGSAKSTLTILENTELKANNVTGFGVVKLVGNGNSNSQQGKTDLAVANQFNVQNLVFRECVDGVLKVGGNLTVNNAIYLNPNVKAHIYTMAGKQIKNDAVIYYEYDKNPTAQYPKVELGIISESGKDLPAGTKIISGKYLDAKKWDVKVITDFESENETEISHSLYLNGNDLYLGNVKQ